MSQFGNYRGRLLALESKFAKLRHQQLRLCDDPARSLRVAKEIVLGKISNQRVILQRRASNPTQFSNQLSEMHHMMDRSASSRDLDQLRGYEGKAAAYYFDALRSF